MRTRHGRSVGTPCHVVRPTITRSSVVRRDTRCFVRGRRLSRPDAALVWRHRKVPRGQTLAVLLPLLAVLVAALWWVLETGEAVAEKQRLRNTAEAAALSAAVWQAKVLNFDAYMNRAIVANEAVIAQSVSLRGWSSYMDHLLPRASVVTSAVSYLGAAMHGLQRGWSLIDHALQPALFVAEGVTSALNHDLATARQVLAMATSGAARSFAVASMDERSAHLDPGVSLPPGEASIRLSLTRGLLPLFGGSFEAGTDASVGLERWRATLAEVGRPGRLIVSISEGIVRTADIEVSQLEVRYYRELFFSPARYVLPTLLKQWDQGLFSWNYYDGDRVPLTATAPISVSRYP